MRVYQGQCDQCGQVGPPRPSASEARAAFRGHCCPTVATTTVDHERVLQIAATAVRATTRATLGPQDYADALSDALYGVAQARVRFDPAAGGSWGGYAYRRACGAVLDGYRSRAHTSRGDWARAGGQVDLLSPSARLPLSVEALSEAGGYDVWSTLGAGVVDPGLEFVSTRDYVEWLLTLVDGREREVLVRYYLLEQSLLQIASWWRVTESRVSQVKAAALARVRRLALADWTGAELAA